MIAKEKIMFVTNFFPSYRKSIWKKLLNNKKSDVIFYFDPIQNQGIQVEKYVNILPQRGWIQSVLKDKDPDLKIWSKDNPSNSRKENNSTRLKKISILLATFLMVCIFFI